MRKHSQQTHFERGVTLLELMIVVVVIGVLASIAIPGYNKWKCKARAGEVSIQFKTLHQGAQFYYFQESAEGSHFPNESSPARKSSVSVQPSRSPCAGGLVPYAKHEANWDIQPWLSLKFSINQAHYFQYVYEANNKPGPGRPSFTLTAQTDRDCDGVFAKYKMTTKRIVGGALERGGIIKENECE